MPRETREEQNRVERRQRRLLGGGQLKMTANKEVGYHYRYANDQGSRIPDMLEAGYDFVPVEGQDTGPGRTATGDARLSMPVGGMDQSTGKPLRAFLMRKPMDWHIEDQAAKQKQVDAIDAAILAARVGQEKFGADADKVYVPTDNGQSRIRVEGPR